MNGNDFLKITDAAFTPFLRDLGFIKGPPAISGRYYQIRYSGKYHVVSVSYEPGDDALFVMVFSRKDDHLSKIDDRIKTPRLSDLNKLYMNMVTNQERVNNEIFFKSVVSQDKEERIVVKAAKELRLVLPKYIASKSNIMRKK